MKLAPKIIIALAAVASVGTFAASASADPTYGHDAAYHSHHDRWAHHHPRQHEVLLREHHQMNRINHEQRRGDISRGEARDLRHQTRAIAREDHADARANGGTITPAQQHHMNDELNAQSHAIGR